LTLQGGNAGKKPAKATERMRRALEDGDDETATEVANNMVRKLQGVGMGKVDKFELGKGLPIFEAGMDLLRYLEDYIFPKVQQPEGGAEVHQWIYEKVKRKFGLQPLVSITEPIEQEFDMSDADTQTLLSIMGGDTDDEAIGSDDEVILGNSRSEDPSTWRMDDELEIFTALGDEDEDVGRWEDGVTFVKMDQVARPGFVMVDDRTGDRTGWVPIEHVRPVFSTPRMTSSTDRRIRRRAAKSTVKAVGFIDVGILASGIYKEGVHEPWMCILIYSRMSGKAQRLDRHLATQFLPLIKDVTTREICAQRSAGRFSEIVLVLIQCVGLSRATSW
jgi:hypothetical protein